jgi:hypothetical protein
MRVFIEITPTCVHVRQCGFEAILATFRTLLGAVRCCTDNNWRNTEVRDLRGKGGAVCGK